MFNLGFSEIIILGVIALIFIGPKELPELARVVGRLMNELRRATSDLKNSFSDLKPELSKLNDYHVPEHKSEVSQPSEAPASADAKPESGERAQSISQGPDDEPNS